MLRCDAAACTPADRRRCRARRDIPGVRQEDINMELDNNVIRVRCARLLAAAAARSPALNNDASLRIR
jgi:hypothetical protein